MECWRYATEGKGLLLSDDIDLSIDSFGKSRKGFTVWDEDSVESMEFLDLGFSEMSKKSFHGYNTGVGMYGSLEVGIDSSKVESTSPSFVIASNSSMESANHFNSLMEINSQDSSFIDLKLGRLVDGKDAQNSKFLKKKRLISSVSPTSQAKRAQTMSSHTQTPFCQVYGCNKDLSSLKDYHKRHKVCKVHSKDPKVIVNGIEQRFCQQCSRFHLLAEFDEGKRSCRKHLAGHNERRRKPPLGGFSGRPHKLLQLYQGTNFLDTSLAKRSSFLFPNILPSGIVYPDKYEQNSDSRPVKSKEKPIHSFPKSFLHLSGNTSGISSPAAEDFSGFSALSSIHDLPVVSNSSCALSLLSAESQNLRHSAGIIMAKPFISQANGFSDKSFGSESSGKHAANVFHSSVMNPIKVNHMGSFSVSCAAHHADLQFEPDGFLHDQEAEAFNAKYSISADDGSTVDLLQLSSHLHRVEQQRNSVQLKHEIEEFFRLLPTYET